MAVILSLRRLRRGPLMISSNPEESRKRGKEMMELMGKQNLPEEMKKPGKDGLSLDSQISDRTPPKRPK